MFYAIKAMVEIITRVRKRKETKEDKKPKQTPVSTAVILMCHTFNYKGRWALKTTGRFNWIEYHFRDRKTGFSFAITFLGRLCHFDNDVFTPLEQDYIRDKLQKRREFFKNRQKQSDREKFLELYKPGITRY